MRSWPAEMAQRKAEIDELRHQLAATREQVAKLTRRVHELEKYLSMNGAIIDWRDV